MTIDAAMRSVAHRLERAGLDDSQMESEFLVAAALGSTRADAIFHRGDALPAQARRKIERWSRRRAERKPLAYIAGAQPFMDLTLRVTPSVLIPRPETELLVEHALNWLRQAGSPVQAADIGTGSGNIAICLALHPNVSRVFAIDRSAKALRVARNNAPKSVSNRLVWMRGDLLEPLKRKKEKVALIAANLPYVSSKDFKRLAPEVLCEPREALEAGREGTEAIFRLIDQAPEALLPGGMLLLEIGYDQKTSALNYLKQASGWTEIQVMRDLAGLPRMVQAVRRS